MGFQCVLSLSDFLHHRYRGHVRTWVWRNKRSQRLEEGKVDKAKFGAIMRRCIDEYNVNVSEAQVCAVFSGPDAGGLRVKGLGCRMWGVECTVSWGVGCRV